MAGIDAAVNKAPISAMPGFRIDAEKLSYKIFSVLEAEFLFGCDGPDGGDRHAAVRKKEDNAALQGIRNKRGKKVCILSLDAGGMRGIIQGKALAYLEAALKKNSGNPEARIADYFDVVAGAGIGGIFAAMLVSDKTPAFQAEETWRFLASEGEKLYASNKKRGFLKRAFRKYGGGAAMERALKAVFSEEKTGRSLTLKDTVKPVLIPCYDLSSAAPFLFSRADALDSESYNFNLWEICLATASDPGVSDPVRMNSVDGKTQCVGVSGALAMSNPTAAAITHVLHNNKEFPSVRGVEDILVLSLGAGSHLLEGSFDCDQVRKWKARDWAQPLARISGDGAADLVDHAVAMAFSGSHRCNYVRVQANGSSFGRCGVETDSDPGRRNVNTLVEMADEMLKQKTVESVLLGGKRIGVESNGEKLDWLAEQMVQEHRRRSSRTLPPLPPTVARKQPAAAL